MLCSSPCSKGSLAALEAALEDGSAGAEGDLQALIYVSCGWDAFKRVSLNPVLPLESGMPPPTS